MTPQVDSTTHPRINLPAFPVELVAELIREHRPRTVEELLVAIGVKITLYSQADLDELERRHPTPPEVREILEDYRRQHGLEEKPVEASYSPTLGLQVYRCERGSESWEEMLRFGIAAYLGRQLGMKNGFDLTKLETVLIRAWQSDAGWRVAEMIDAAE